MKRGYHLLCTHALTLLAIPLAATGTVRVHAIAGQPLASTQTTDAHPITTGLFCS